MENKIIKRGRGRPRVLTDEERRKNKTKYMLETPWFCEMCNNNQNYSLAGKWSHLKTAKHRKYVNIMKINNITQRLNP